MFRRAKRGEMVGLCDDFNDFRCMEIRFRVLDSKFYPVNFCSQKNEARVDRIAHFFCSLIWIDFPSFCKRAPVATRMHDIYHRKTSRGNFFYEDLLRKFDRKFLKSSGKQQKISSNPNIRLKVHYTDRMPSGSHIILLHNK